MRINGQELLTVETTCRYGVRFLNEKFTIQDPTNGEIKDITQDLFNTGHIEDGKLCNVYVMCPEVVDKN
jgi:hypothetical protein